MCFGAAVGGAACGPRSPLLLRHKRAEGTAHGAGSCVTPTGASRRAESVTHCRCCCCPAACSPKVSPEHQQGLTARGHTWELLRSSLQQHCTPLSAGIRCGSAPAGAAAAAAVAQKHHPWRCASAGGCGRLQPWQAPVSWHLAHVQRAASCGTCWALCRPIPLEHGAPWGLLPVSNLCAAAGTCGAGVLLRGAHQWQPPRRGCYAAAVTAHRGPHSVRHSAEAD